MEIAKQIGRIILTEDEKRNVLQTGAMNCPLCEKSMTFYPAPQSQKPEITCHECKISAPLWR